MPGPVRNQLASRFNAGPPSGCASPWIVIISIWSGHSHPQDARLIPPRTPKASIPQVAPTLAGISVFRWDINIRESTVLGLVGAGGIGVKLEGALATLAWPKVTMLLILILVTVVFSEWVTAKVREKLI